MSKIYKINLSTKEINSEEINKDHPLEFFAGRSLSSKIVSDEVPPNCDALGRENKLIISSGFLTGTPAPNSGRFSIGGKSPLTGGIKEANVGGRAPAIIGQLDIRAIIIEGISENKVILKVDENSIEIIDGTQYFGLNNYKLAEQLMKDFGSNIGALSIGLAGENLFLGASIASIDPEGYPSRHAARGGLGAVMGSKNVKAIVIVPSKEKKITYNDYEEFSSISKTWFKEKYNASRSFSKYGTATMVNVVNEVYGLPTQNFRRGRFKDADKISGEALHEYLVKNNGKFSVGCSPGCSVRCSNIVIGPDGNHITSGLEYETIALNGSNLMINEIEKLAWIDHYCDDLGIDSIEAGNIFAVLMEAKKIAWGDADAVINFLKSIPNNKINMELLSLGCLRLAEKLGVSRVAHVKGQGFPGYDPRSFKGMGVTFATSPMGADHTAGPAIKGRNAYANKDYKSTQIEDSFNKVLLSKELQEFIVILDSIGLCYFMGPSYEILRDKIVPLLNSMYGWDKDAEFWVQFTKDCLQNERDYNIKVGIGPEQDKLPDFFLKEKLEDIDREWDIDQKELSNIWEDI